MNVIANARPGDTPRNITANHHLGDTPRGPLTNISGRPPQRVTAP